MGGSFDHIGPYQEEPNSTDFQHPKPAMQNWTDEVSNSSESTFCVTHKTGYWCNGFTRIRCCMLEGAAGYAKCGSSKFKFLWLAGSCCKRHSGLYSQRILVGP